jgi:hypothetical protein
MSIDPSIRARMPGRLSASITLPFCTPKALSNAVPESQEVRMRSRSWEAVPGRRLTRTLVTDAASAG